MKHLRPALFLFILLTVVTGIIYPFAVTMAGQTLFPVQANGSLIDSNGSVIGSNLIGQSFTSARYFHGRLSATSPAPYNAGASGGSNLGPTSKTLINNVQSAAETLRNEDVSMAVPVDLVTSSGSGLDPDITPAAARFQIPRIAKARNLTDAQVQALIDRNTDYRTLGFIGEPHVNVLKLNMALDGLEKNK